MMQRTGLPGVSRKALSDAWEQSIPSRPWVRQAPATRRSFQLYQRDPVAYAFDQLKVKALTDDQQEILFSVRDRRRTAAKASHAIGKTFTASIAANWWFDCWDEHIVYITAPSWHQALNLTYKQIKRFRLNNDLPGEVLDSGMVKDRDRKRQPAHFIKALNAQTGEGFQGEHSAPILIIMEEAVGVPPYIWAASDGLMTHPECRVLAIFNPTDEASNAGEASKSPLYNVLTINALHHPNIAAELACTPPLFPDAVRLLWLAEMLEKECETAEDQDGDCFEWWALEHVKAALPADVCLEGEGRPVTEDTPRQFYRPTADFEGRVLGRFPTQADEQVIPSGWLTRLPGCERENAIPEIGCDIALFGSDRTVIAVRQGPHVTRIRELRQMDTAVVTQALRDMATQAAADADLPLVGKKPPEKRIPIRIDVTGGLGAGPYDTLRKEGYTVIPMNASSRATDFDHFKNLRSEMWFVLRDRVRLKRIDLSLLPADTRQALIKELSTPKYTMDGGGKKVVEPKDKIKEKLHFSPDMADAVNMAFTERGEWWRDEETIRYMQSRHGIKIGDPDAEEPPAEGGSKVPLWAKDRAAGHH